MFDFEKIKRLDLPLASYAIFGSGPMAVRNIRSANDIDIIVKPELWQDLSKKHKVRDSRLIIIDEIEIYKDWLPWIENASGLIDEAELIGGLPFVGLNYVVEWKRQMARDKDLKDIALIEKYLEISGKKQV